MTLVRTIKFNKKISGFTLIELLISLSIFLTITTILLYSFKNLHYTSRQSQKSMKLYETTNDFLEKISQEIHNIYIKKHHPLLYIEGGPETLTFTTAQFSKLLQNEMDISRITYQFKNKAIFKQSNNFLKKKPALEKKILSAEEVSFEYLLNGEWLSFCEQHLSPEAIKITIIIKNITNSKILKFSTIAKLQLKI